MGVVIVSARAFHQSNNYGVSTDGAQPEID